MAKFLLLSPMLVVCSAIAVAQSTPAPPVYDAAVVKLNKTVSRGTDIDTDDATFQATNVSLKRLLANAYGLHEDLIAGLPGWANSERFDINAKVVDPDIKALRALTREQRRAMLAALVTERFHLKVHTEVKTLPVYELVVSKDGPKLTASAAGPGDDADSGDMSVRNTDMTATGVKMAGLAESLSSRLDRTVIDKTGLTGRYDFRLQWTPESAANAAADSGQNDAPPIIFTAIQEQLGLKLQSAKGPVTTLVVDHVEEPTEN